jgi:hypothetical protein
LTEKLGVEQRPRFAFKNPKFFFRFHDHDSKYTTFSERGNEKVED